MNVLILGASGRIGFFLSKYFKDKKNINCYAVVRNFPAYCLLKKNNVNVFNHDFSSTKEITNEIISIEYDIVINCAYDIKNPSEMLKKNYLILKNISKLNFKLLINLSSISIYGKSLFDFNNYNNISPDNYYSKLKYKLEVYAAKLCKKNKTNLINLRLGNVHGEGQLWSDIFHDIIKLNTKIKLLNKGDYFSNCINIKSICHRLDLLIKSFTKYNGIRSFNFVDEEKNQWSDILNLYNKNLDFTIVSLTNNEFKQLKKEFKNKYSFYKILLNKIKQFFGILLKDDIIKDKIFYFFSYSGVSLDKKIMTKKRINKIKNFSLEKVIDEPVFYYKSLNYNNFHKFIEKMSSK